MAANEFVHRQCNLDSFLFSPYDRILRGPNSTAAPSTPRVPWRSLCRNRQNHHDSGQIRVTTSLAQTLLAWCCYLRSSIKLQESAARLVGNERCQLHVIAVAAITVYKTKDANSVLMPLPLRFRDTVLHTAMLYFLYVA